MENVLSLLEEEKRLKERLEELSRLRDTRRLDAVEDLKRIILENCLTYSDIREVVEEVKRVSGPEPGKSSDVRRGFRSGKSYAYWSEEHQKGWSGGGDPPPWVLKNVDKLDEWLQPRARGKVHTPTALRLLNRQAKPESVIEVKREVDHEKVAELSEQLNKLYSNFHLELLRKKYNELDEATQEAVFDYLEPATQNYLLR